jgi:hypothetical protein
MRKVKRQAIAALDRAVSSGEEKQNGSINPEFKL